MSECSEKFQLNRSNRSRDINYLVRKTKWWRASKRTVSGDNNVFMNFFIFILTHIATSRIIFALYRYALYVDQKCFCDDIFGHVSTMFRGRNKNVVEWSEPSHPSLYKRMILSKSVNLFFFSLHKTHHSFFHFFLDILFSYP